MKRLYTGVMLESEKRLLAYCERKGIPGIVLRRRSNIAWAAGGADVHCDTATGLGVAALVWSPERKLCFTDVIEAARLREEEPFESLGWTVESMNWWDADTRIASLVAEGYGCDWPEDPLYEERATLSAAEVASVRDLGRETAEVVERLLKNDCKPGMTEWHLGGAVAGWLRDRGIQAHVCLIASDERIARYRHPIPTRKAIEKLAMVAVCAQRGGLIVSLTRLVSFAPLSDDLKRKHAACVSVDRALHAASVPGSRWCDALAAGVREYAAHGFPEEWTLHHQGGPMGYECRDFKATPSETRLIRPRQLIGWNPSITGTKSEDTVLTGADGGATAENVTRTGAWPEMDGRPAILVR